MRDLDSVADELYGLRPDRFTAARNARAVEARRAGDPALADRIGALRKPTLAAWTSNLLVRERREETRSLVALGEALRRAHHELDGERLRDLGHRRHLVVRALAREAGQLAAQAGQPVGEDVLREVEATLNAALTDPEAAEEWAAGRLVRPLSAPVGFTAAAPAAVAERPRRRPPDTPEKAREGKEEREAEEERRARLERARQEAAETEREAHEREERHRRAQADRERAEAQLHEAERRAAALAAELRDAEERRHTAAAEAREARDRAREAEREARRARRRAEEAAEKAAQEERSPGRSSSGRSSSGRRAPGRSGGAR
ncbi:hypothetical protein ACIRNI_22315 [Streptomyces sp. NPDC093546]|uniref:hypothetical protein n=1 Tax=Streptomyces sp. NPDC093546 TaxID=3366040 RepID=UPI0038132812